MLVLFGAFLHHAGAIGEALADEQIIPLTEKGTDVFYLQARLGDTDTELLFDTGSGYLALNEQTLSALEEQGLATYQRKIRARMANGRVSEVPVYEISAISLGDSCTLHNVEAAMLKGTTRNILGMNVLRAVDGFNFSFSDSTLTLKGCGQPRVAGL